ncbi:hypothetical protein BDA99DRAFT_555417 [Phascolomyces articulosus]|uniref:Zn(2)-C6 fungal-type domain-containing protein n=1 Tax=Phascolomyces articulosus TaxID=60185 RepID=A0AAD5K9F6_9FUNG|nr:hypothetical protein BDA99DRAFT_555417 [Phascolomyces articulosus]
MKNNSGSNFRWHSCSKDDFPFKRHKVPKACQLCRQKKMRCDGLFPCARCTQSNLECSYEDDGNRRRRSEHITVVNKLKDEVSNSDDGSSSQPHQHSNNNTNDIMDDTMITATSSSSSTLEPGNHQYNLSYLPPQQQQQSDEFKRSNLKRITFSNNLYESMRQTDTSVIGKSYFFGTQLAPLLFDFFNLTSQPYKIWLHFIAQFRQFLKTNNNNNDHPHHHHNNNHRSHHHHKSSTVPPHAIPDHLAKEIINLFSKFNWLYSTMFNFTTLHTASAPALSQLFCPTTPSSSLNNNNSNSNSSGLQTPTSTNSPNNNNVENNNNNGTMEQTIVYAIHALVFHAAFQSLATSCHDIASSLEYYADLFYQEAQRRFWESILVVDKHRSLDTTALLQLARISVLLAHYECAALYEEQAYQTLRTGIGFALRARLSDIINNNNSHHEHYHQSKQVNERKRLKALYLILNAWHVWFSFYLHRYEWADDENQVPPLSPTTNKNSSSSFLLPKMNDATGDSKGAKQRWALQVVDIYTEFLKQLSKHDMTFSEIKGQLEALQSWTGVHSSDIHARRNSSDSQQEDARASPVSIPACILALYHHTLTIHIFFCQIPASVHLFRNNTTSSFVHGINEKTANNNNNKKALSFRDTILEICDESAADIVHVIDDLTLEHHTLPSGTTDQVRQCKLTVHSFMYPLCLAASISVSVLRQRKLSLEFNQTATMEEDLGSLQQQLQHIRARQQSKKRSSIQATEATITTAASTIPIEPKTGTLMPFYKLRRLLNPISSHIEMLNVFQESLVEIQATAVSSNKTSPQPMPMTAMDPMQHRYIPVPSASSLPPTTIATATTATAAAATMNTSMMTHHSHMAAMMMNPQLQRPPPPPPQHPATKPSSASSSSSASRFIDHQWPEALGQVFSDESLLTDGLPLQGSTMSGRPLDRNDIDREQLEKLSHKKDLRSNTSSAKTSSAGSNVVNGMQTTMGGGTTAMVTNNLDMFRTHNTLFSEAAAAAAAAAAAVTGGNVPTAGLPMRNTMATTGPPTTTDAYAMRTIPSGAIRKRRNTVGVQQQHHQQQTLLAHGQKRHYAATVPTTTNYPNLDMDYQQQQQLVPSKRMRTDSAYSDQMEILRTDRHQQQQQQRYSTATAAASADATNGNFNRTQQQMSNNLNIQDIQDQSGIPMYTTDFLLMDLSDTVAAAAAATTTTVSSTSSNPILYQQSTPTSRVHMDRNNNNPPHHTLRNEPPPTPEPFTTSNTSAVTPTTGSHHSMVNNITSNAPKVTLLPIPQTNPIPNKSWVSRHQKDWTEDFNRSVLETLHNTQHMNSEATSFGPGMVDPSSMSLNIDPMTSHTTQQPNLNDSNSMFIFFGMNQQQQQQQQQHDQQQRLTHASHQQQQGGGGWGVDQQQQQASLTRLQNGMRRSGLNMVGHNRRGTSGTTGHYQQRRNKSPQSMSINHHPQQQQAPSLSEPTNSSASDDRSPSASPAMFAQEQWLPDGGGGGVPTSTWN